MARVKYSTIVRDVTFKELGDLVTVDLNNRPIQFNQFTNGFRSCTKLKTVKRFPSSLVNMSYTFLDCVSLENIPAIPSSCQNMYGTFVNCSKFNSQVTIPNSVTNLEDCFRGCTSLDKQPILNNNIESLYRTFENTALTSFSNIPNSVTNMEWCFRECAKLTSVSDLPSSLANLKQCFYNCTSLTTIPSIPASVTNLNECFYNCTNLAGDISIRSLNVTNANNCFYLSESNTIDRNVFIDFSSTTYQSFVSAGYSDTTRKHGVLLLPLDYQYVTFSIVNLIDARNAVVKVTYDGVEHTCLNTLNTHSNRSCPTGACRSNKFYLPIPANKSFTYSVSLVDYDTKTGSGTAGTGNESQDIQITLTHATKTFTVNVTPTGSHVALYNGGEYIGESNDTISYTHNTGSRLPMKIICRNNNYPSITQNVEWNTDSDFVRNIDMVPVSGEVLYESNTAGQVSTLQLGANRLYEITCVGGGGGSGDINGGGAGAVWKGNINTDRNITLTMTTGSGGQAGQSNKNGEDGTSSSITSTSNISIITEGGRGGSSFIRSYSVYTGRKKDPRYPLNYSIGPKVNMVQSNSVINFSKTEQRQLSWLNGTTYGMGANTSFQNGEPGYIKIKYLGELTPGTRTGTEILRRTTAGSGSIQLEAGTYTLICVGGGGGALSQYTYDESSENAGKSYKATGGSGSYLNVVVQLEAGTYNWSVGALGTTNYYPNTATDGGNTTFGNFVAYGGKAAIFLDGMSFGNTGVPGTFTYGYGGNVPQLDTPCVEMRQVLQGNDGQADQSLTTDHVLAGGQSPYMTCGKGSGFTVKGFFDGPYTDQGTDGCLIIIKLSEYDYITG